MSSLVSKVIVNGEECNEVRCDVDGGFETLTLGSNILNDQTTINNDTKGYLIFDKTDIYTYKISHDSDYFHKNHITKIFTDHFAIPIYDGCYLITTPQYCKRVFNLFVEKDDKIILGDSEEITFEEIWGKFYTSEKDKRYMLYYNPDTAIFYLIKKTAFDDLQTPKNELNDGGGFGGSYYNYSPRVYIASTPRTLTFNGKEETYEIGEMVSLDRENNKVFFKIYNSTNEAGYMDSYAGSKDNTTYVSLGDSNFIEEYTDGMESDLGTNFNCSYNIDFKLRKSLFKKKIDCQIKNLSSEYWLNLPFRYNLVSVGSLYSEYNIESIFIKMKVFILNSDDYDTWGYIYPRPNPEFDNSPTVDGGFRCSTSKIYDKENAKTIGRNYTLYNNDNNKDFFGYFYDVPDSEENNIFSYCNKLYYFYRNSNCSSMEMYIPTEILGLYYFTTTTKNKYPISYGDTISGIKQIMNIDRTDLFFPLGKGRLYEIKHNGGDYEATVGNYTYYFNFNNTSIDNMYNSLKKWNNDATDNYPNYFLNASVKKTISHIKVI